MKSISTYLFLICIPMLAFSQNPQFETRSPHTIPYLFSKYKQPQNAQIFQLYKIQSSLPLYAKAASAVLMPVVQSLDSIITTPADSTLPSRKAAYEYNIDGLQTSHTNYDWDTLNKRWNNVLRELWTYNTLRYILSYTTNYGDGLDWFNEIQNEFIYDANNRLIRIDGSGWNETDSKWELGSKAEYTYNGEDQVSEIVFSEWDGSQWNPYSKFTYEYNFSGQVVVAIELEWQGQWVNRSRGEFDYYIFGSERNFYFDVWDGFTTWVKFSRSEAIYNADHNLDIFREQLWDLISVLYVDLRKAEYNYNIDLNMNQCIHSIWVKQQQDFILEARENCVYNTQYSRNDLLLPPDLKFSQSTNRVPDNEIYFQDMLTTYSHFLHNGTTYIPNSMSNLYYSPKTITHSNPESKINFNIQPNPSGDYITIVSNQLKYPAQLILYDISGAEKINQILESGDKIHLGFLPNGTYIYTLSDSNHKINSGKILHHK